MKHLEDELRKALRRKQPPEGFAERVLSKTETVPRGVWFNVFVRHGLRWALAGVMCLLLLAVGIRYRQAKEEYTRGEAAKTQLMLALRITADKLQFAQLKLQQHGIQRMYRN
jgi:hypothetical protein